MTTSVASPARQKWEYNLLTRKTESYLLSEIQVLGQEGWELVSVLYYKDLKGIMVWTGFLKRPCGEGGARPTAPSLGGAPAASHSPEPPKKEDASVDGFDLSGGDFDFKDE